jgi:RNA polymerase sigma factor for flagellar operon FliA
MPEDRGARIERLFPLVRIVARQVLQMVPGSDIDDLIGDGSVGLIRAVDTYDAGRGASLERYARHVMVGAMLNGLRKRDPVSERSRRLIREVERERYTYAQTHGVMPTTAELERDRSGFARANLAVYSYMPLSLDAPMPPGTRFAKVDNDPADLVAEIDECERLEQAIEALPKRERTVIKLHYQREQPLRCIAQTMSVSSQRASQLHLAGLGRLRKATLR